MKKKLLSLLLIITIIVSVFPAMVLAQDSTVASITLDGVTTDYTDTNEFLRELSNFDDISAKKIDIKLFDTLNVENEMHMYSLSVPNGKNITFDLNGYSFLIDNSFDVFLRGNLIIKNGTISKINVDGSLDYENLNITFKDVYVQTSYTRNLHMVLEGTTSFEELEINCTGDSYVTTPSVTSLSIPEGSNVNIGELRLTMWDSLPQTISSQTDISGNLTAESIYMESGPYNTDFNISDTGVVDVKNIELVSRGDASSTINNDNELIVRDTLKNGGSIINNGTISYNGEVEGNPITGNEVSPIHIHSWDSAWTSDSNYHWHECTNDNCPITENSEKDGYGKHEYDNDSDIDCNICAFKRTISNDSNNNQNDNNNNNQNDTNNTNNEVKSPGTGDNNNIGLWICFIIVSICSLVAVILKRKRA